MKGEARRWIYKKKKKKFIHFHLRHTLVPKPCTNHGYCKSNLLLWTREEKKRTTETKYIHNKMIQSREEKVWHHSTHTHMPRMRRRNSFQMKISTNTMWIDVIGARSNNSNILYTVSDEIVSLIFDEIVKEVEEEGDKNEWLTQSMKRCRWRNTSTSGQQHTHTSAEKQMTQISNENDYINTIGCARPRRTAAHSRCEEIYIWHISTSAMTSININLLKLWLLLILRWRAARTTTTRAQWQKRNVNVSSEIAYIGFVTLMTLSNDNYNSEKCVFQIWPGHGIV